MTSADTAAFLAEKRFLISGKGMISLFKFIFAVIAFLEFLEDPSEKLVVVY